MRETTEFLNTQYSKRKNGITFINPKNNLKREWWKAQSTAKQNFTHQHTKSKLQEGLYVKKAQLTSMKSGSDRIGLERSTVERGSILRWPLWPEKPTRNESSFVATIGSISYHEFCHRTSVLSRLRSVTAQTCLNLILPVLAGVRVWS